MGCALSAARIDVSGKVTALGAKPSPDEVVTEVDVQDPPKLARLLARVLSEVAALKRRWAPRFVDFEDLLVTSTSTTKIQLQHNLNGRVRWWVVDYQISGAAGGPIIERNATDTTSSTLVLRSYKDARVTIRVEEAG